jgi:hypothetical protein
LDSLRLLKRPAGKKSDATVSQKVKMEPYVTFVVSNVHVVWSNTDEFFKTIHIRFQLHEEMSSKWYVDGERLQGGNHHIQIAFELFL